MARYDNRFIICTMWKVGLKSLVLLSLLLCSCISQQIEIEPTMATIPIKHARVTPSVTLQLAPTHTSIRAPIHTSTPISTVTVVSPVASATPLPVPQFCSPLAEQSVSEILEIVSDPYNPPSPGKEDRHHGTDLAYYRRKNRTTIEGEGVEAWLAGKVVAVITDQLPYGNMVIIETSRNDLPSEFVKQIDIPEGKSLYTLYAHFSSNPYVVYGDKVFCGQHLGEVGATGLNIVNPHLHIETRIGPSNKEFKDGMAYYDTRTTDIERSNYELWRTSGIFRHFDPMIVVNYFLSIQSGK